jgi:DNA-directed RNA polymerase specialized sigma24 family protein
MQRLLQPGRQHLRHQGEHEGDEPLHVGRAAAVEAFTALGQGERIALPGLSGHRDDIRARFWEAFERCLDRLPKAGGRVFFQREVLGEETETICKAEGITPSNCWVILHRARIALRACLEKSWFGKEAVADG